MLGPNLTERKVRTHSKPSTPGRNLPPKVFTRTFAWSPFILSDTGLSNSNIVRYFIALSYDTNWSSKQPSQVRQSLHPLQAAYLPLTMASLVRWLLLSYGPTTPVNSVRYLRDDKRRAHHHPRLYKLSRPLINSRSRPLSLRLTQAKYGAEVSFGIRTRDSWQKRHVPLKKRLEWTQWSKVQAALSKVGCWFF